LPTTNLLDEIIIFISGRYGSTSIAKATAHVKHDIPKNARTIPYLALVFRKEVSISCIR
jgi:hypothetical protein